MKKLSVLLALVAGSFLSFSQNNNSIIPPAPIEESKFSFGFTGGFGHSFIAPYENYKFMPSWNAGISTVYSPFVHFGMGMDVFYSEEGMKYGDAEGEHDISLNYIRVPFKAIYFFRPYEKDFRPKISIAPTVGFLVNGNDKPQYNTFDFGASAAVGFNYRLVRAIWLNVDAVYYQGFIDNIDGNGVTDLNGNVRLNMGLSFGF